MGGLLQDLRYGARQLHRSPGFALVVVLSLAIGIGLNTAVFSGMDALVLRPLALPRMDRVVTLAEQRTDGADEAVALANYQDWLRDSQSFESLGVRKDSQAALTGSGGAEEIATSLTSGSLFRTLRLRAQLGRVYEEDECRPGRDAVAVLTYGFWQSHFAGDPAIVGRTIELDQRAYTVIGVTPKSLQYPSTTDVYLPLAPLPGELADRRSHDYLVSGRLRDGVTLRQAQAEMRSVSERLAAQYPATNKSATVHVEALRDDITGPYTPAYYRMMLGGTLLVLLVVCANVANLQLVRSIARSPEIAMRTALGASPWRVLRQSLAENLLLSLTGAAGGLAFGKLCLHLIVLIMPDHVARMVTGWSNMALSGRALVFSLLLAGVAGTVAAVAPALASLRMDPLEQLKAGSRTSIGSGRSHRLRNLFAVAQIALAVCLVVGAALSAKGLNVWFHVADAFHPDRTLSFQVSLPASRYATPQQRAGMYTASLARLRALPGVTHAELMTALPYDDNGWVRDVEIAHRPAMPGKFQNAFYLPVTSGYFAALGLPLLSGRNFDSRDTSFTQPAAVVSERFAAAYFAGQSPLGHQIRMGGQAGHEPWLTIVGVVKETNYNLWDPSVHPAVYLNTLQALPASTGYLLTTDGDPMSLASAAHAAMATLDPLLPLHTVESYRQLLHDNLIGLIYVAGMLGFDAVFALFLAALGIFAVMNHLVHERMREIGVRLALGARRENVLAMVFGRVGRLIGSGLAAGLVLAFLLARGLRSLLQGVQPDDPLVFAGVAGAIAMVALVSSWLPARRAVRADPMIALREE